MERPQRGRSHFRRHISIVLAASFIVLGTATRAAAQCAYPALELLEFSYVNRALACMTAPGSHSIDPGEHSARIEYEFEGRLLVIDTFLRWLNLDAAAEAWTSLPASTTSR